MKKVLWLLPMVIAAYAYGRPPAEDSLKTERPKFVSLQIADGFVAPTSRIRKDAKIAPHLTAFSLKYGVMANGDKWEDYYYGMPYKGFGVYKPFFTKCEEIGNPFSVFLFQGATLKEFGDRLSLDYEINLGVSFNWNHYDAVRSPDFLVTGSSINAHLAGDLFLRQKISDHFDLLYGVNVSHFSNGSTRTPNYGINPLSAYVEVAYNINGRRKLAEKIAPPDDFEKRRIHDFSVFVTGRTVSLDTTGTQLRLRFPKQYFTVAGISYNYMFHSLRSLLWGPGIDLVYDEGNRVGIVSDSSSDAEYNGVVQLAKLSDRFQAGLSIKGEVLMPGYSIFMSLGYDIIHANNKDERLYQNYGIKIRLFDGLYTSLGVRSTELTHSRFLYVNLGYTFGR